MPGYKTHIAGGAIAGAAAVFAAVHFDYISFDPKIAAILVGISTLGALFPDVDTDSKGQNLFYVLLLGAVLGLMAIKKFMWAALVGVFAILPAIGRHRGWTHSWWAAFAVPLPLLLLPIWILGWPVETTAYFYCPAVIGYLSHLILDKLI